MANRRQALREQTTARPATAVPNLRRRRSEVLSKQPKNRPSPGLPSTDGDACALGILPAFSAAGLFLVWRGSYIRFFTCRAARFANPPYALKKIHDPACTAGKVN